MPEYHSGKKHDSGFSGEIHIGNYTSQRMRLLREKRRGDKPELTEEEELQKIRDEFGKRIAIASEQQKDVATVEHESQVQHKPQPQPKQPELEYEVETEAHSEATLVEQSLQAYQQKDYANAYELFSQIVAQQPDNYEALFHLGVSATETGNHTVAIETTKKLIDSGHFTAQAFYFQGISLEKLGRKPEASIAYQKAAAEIPEAHKSFMRLESEKLLGGFSSKIASPENQGRQSQSRKVAKSPQPTKSASTSPKSSKPTQSSRSVREDTTFNQSGRPSNYPRKDTTSEQPKKQSSRKAEKPFKPSSKSNSSFNFRGKDIAPTLLVKQGKSATKANQQLDVTKLVPVEKLAEAVSRSAKALPEEVAEELRALFTPATLATMVGVFAAYIAAHATGIGQAMDIGMLIAGGIFFGLDAFAIFKDIAGFAGAVNATTEEELDRAGEHLASAVASIGMDAVMTLLTKKVADEVGKTVDHVDRVDEVHAHHDPNGAGNLDNADNINAGRVNDVDNATSSNLDETKALSALDNYEYSEGINFQTDQPEHLTTVLNFTQKKGVKGAHTTDSFNQAVADYNLRIVSKTEHPTVKGLYEIVYEIPLKNKKLEYTGDYKVIKEPKTVYDPSIISNDKILEWGQQAADKGIDNAIANGKREFTETANGIDFRVYIDPKTKAITNFFPVFR